jgi:hypothetical protein
LQERPVPLPSPLAPDAFDAKGAEGTVREIARTAPDRPAGSEGDRTLAAMVAARLRALPGVEVSRDDFSAESNGKDVRMTNVTGVLSGDSDRQIVLLASRDASVRPGASSAADTALLLELARALAGVRHQKTIVLVSTDGAQDDSAGARRFAASYPDMGKVDAGIVLDDAATRSSKQPYLVPWAAGTRRAALQVQRTVETALQREVGSGAGLEGSLGQFVRLAWPLTLREQGPLEREGLDAVTLTSHGEVPFTSTSGALSDVSAVRLLQVGKAALVSTLAFDSAGSLESSPGTYLVSGRQVMPGWALSLLVFALLAPVLAATADGFARARRRGRVLGGWLRWCLAAALPFVAVFASAYIFELFGWLPATASEALSPATRPSFSEAAPALGALLVLFLLAWLVLRPLLLGRVARERLQEPEAALSLSFLLSLSVLVLWASNPFAALLLVPVCHLVLFHALPDSPRRRPLAALTVLGALSLPLIVLLYYGATFDLGLDPTRYGLLLLAGGGSLPNVLLVSLLAGCSLSALLVATALPSAKPAPGVTIRGPRTYAGPGSLGGTESAYRP